MKWSVKSLFRAFLSYDSYGSVQSSVGVTMLLEVVQGCSRRQVKMPMECKSTTQYSLMAFTFVPASRFLASSSCPKELENQFFSLEFALAMVFHNGNRNTKTHDA